METSWPVLRIYHVRDTQEQEFCHLVLSMVAWARRLSGVVESRAFRDRNLRSRFYSWIAWESLSGRDRALQSALWPRIVATMQPALRDVPHMYILETIFRSGCPLSLHAQAILALVRCVPGSEEGCRRALASYGQDVAGEIGPSSIVLAQSIEDRSTFVGLFDMPGGVSERTPILEDGTLKTVEWVALDPVRASGL